MISRSLLHFSSFLLSCTSEVSSQEIDFFVPQFFCLFCFSFKTIMVWGESLLLISVKRLSSSLQIQAFVTAALLTQETFWLPLPSRSKRVSQTRQREIGEILCVPLTTTATTTRGKQKNNPNLDTLLFYVIQDARKTRRMSSRAVRVRPGVAAPFVVLWFSELSVRHVLRSAVMRGGCCYHRAAERKDVLPQNVALYFGLKSKQQACTHCFFDQHRPASFC